jgi:DNA helicase II / ATP-dependent DNA helicase PcrA
MRPNVLLTFVLCSKKIIKRLMQPHKEALQALLEKAVTLTERTLQAMISKAKSKGLTPEDILKEASTGITTKHEIDRLVGEIYAEYEQTLRKSNSLDFDDLLLFGLRLFREYTGAVEWCQHVLVDELSAFFRLYALYLTDTI